MLYTVVETTSSYSIYKENLREAYYEKYLVTFEDGESMAIKSKKLPDVEILREKV